MYKYEFHLVMNLMDTYIRSINKHYSNNIRVIEASDDAEARAQLLADTFHMVRVGAVLMHPIAPLGTQKILDYLGLDESFWSWDRIFDTVYDFMDDPHSHKRSEEHTSELQSRPHLVCRLLLDKKNNCHL